MIRIMVAALASCVWLTPSIAAEKTTVAIVNGNVLLERCQFSQTFCYGYIIGVIDTYSGEKRGGRMYRHVRRWIDPRSTFFCLHKTIKIDVVVIVVKKYIVDHPEHRHYSGTAIVGQALLEAFPCPDL